MILLRSIEQINDILTLRNSLDKEEIKAITKFSRMMR
jgi:hypothetical protein